MVDNTSPSRYTTAHGNIGCGKHILYVPGKPITTRLAGCLQEMRSLAAARRSAEEGKGELREQLAQAEANAAIAVRREEQAQARGRGLSTGVTSMDAFLLGSRCAVAGHLSRATTVASPALCFVPCFGFP